MKNLPGPLGAVKGRVVYILAVMLTLQLTCPLSLLGQAHNTLYFSLHCALLVSGVVASVNRLRFLTTSGVALLNLAVGIP